MSRQRVAILISGRGTNMAALIAAARQVDFPAEVALVMSNRPAAGGLAIAQRDGIPTMVVDHSDYGRDREGFEQAMQSVLDTHAIELVCLAGFMRLLTPWFVSRWEGRMINIHPALLPAFKGLHTHERALAAGVKIHGATVHFVVPDVDSGPIIAQAAVPVLAGDTPENLAARVLAAENRLYPRALQLVAAGAVTVAPDATARITAAATATGALFVPDLSPDTV